MTRILIIITLCLALIKANVYAQRDIQHTNSWAYQLQNLDVNTISANDSFQLLVSDYSHDGTDANKLSPTEVAAVKNSGKLFIGYISIGEAEDYRSYWQNSWNTAPPTWLDSVNPNWPGNYKVRYWDTAWQHIVYNYIDTVISQGFDGAYLDIIDAWYYWQSEVSGSRQIPNADSLMIDFVVKLRSHVNSVTGNSNFIIIPQNGEDLIFQNNISPAQKSQYYNAINALGIEDVFFTGPNNEDNPCAPDYYRINNLQQYQAEGKKIFNIEYLTQTAKITQYRDSAKAYTFVPYACTRALDQLCSSLYTAIDPIKPSVFHVYPNPVSGAAIFINTEMSDNSFAMAELMDITGRTVYTWLIQPSWQQAPVRFTLPQSIPNGVYNLYLYSNGQSGNSRVIVIR